MRLAASFNGGPAPIPSNPHRPGSLASKATPRRSWIRGIVIYAGYLDATHDISNIVDMVEYVMSHPLWQAPG
jgi:hypothetical protein